MSEMKKRINETNERTRKKRSYMISSCKKKVVGWLARKQKNSNITTQILKDNKNRSKKKIRDKKRE